jgi:APA family basic amino acid/polyamine antiporter
MRAVTELQRRLGVPTATAIGVAAMLGAGIFFVWAPAARVAGTWLLVGLAIAALVATLNALSTAQLAMAHPVSGGAYSYGRAELSPTAGFAAGALFLVGKTASVAAIALVAGSYLAPGYERWVAAALVVTLTVVNASGIRSTAVVSFVIAGVVVTVLVVTLVAAAASGPAASDEGGTASGALPAGAYGVLQAASLIFFSFAGYARVATLGEEVREPRRTIPIAVVSALVLVLALSVATAVVLLTGLGVDALAASSSPLAELAGPGWELVVRAGAGVACVGSLLGVLAALSRTSLAMARGGDLPAGLARIARRTSTPVVADVVVALVALLAVATLEPALVVGVSACAVLGYYGVANASAFRQARPARWLPRVVPALGLLGCAVLALTAPWQAVVGVAAYLIVVLLLRFLVASPRRSRTGA